VDMFSVFSGVCVLAAVTIVVGRAYGSRRSGIGTPVCGKCGYPTEGLPTEVCPECGTDRTQVGVRTIPAKRIYGNVFRIAVWTLVVSLVGFAVHIVLFMHFPKPPETYVSQHWISLEPRSQAYTFILAGQQNFGEASAKQDDCSIVLQDGMQYWETVHVQLPELQCTFVDITRDGDRSSTCEASAEVFVRWMREVGIKTDDKRIHAEAQDLLRVLQRLGSGETLSKAAHGLDALRPSPVVFTKRGEVKVRSEIRRIEVPICLLVWVGGIVYLVRKSARAKPGRAGR